MLVSVGLEEEWQGVTWGLARGGVGDGELEGSVEGYGGFGEVEFGVGIGVEDLDIEAIRVGGRIGGDELDSAAGHGFGEVAFIDELDEESFEANFVDGVFVAEHGEPAGGIQLDAGDVEKAGFVDDDAIGFLAADPDDFTATHARGFEKLQVGGQVPSTICVRAVHDFEFHLLFVLEFAIDAFLFHENALVVLQSANALECGVGDGEDGLKVGSKLLEIDGGERFGGILLRCRGIGG